MKAIMIWEQMKHPEYVEKLMAKKLPIKEYKEEVPY